MTSNNAAQDQQYQDDDELNLVNESTKKESDKKCNGCGGRLVFDPGSGGLICEYCEEKEEIILTEEEKKPAKETPLDKASETNNNDWGTAKKTIVCKQCGAESIYDALQVSDTCPYCDSVQVMEEKGKDTMAPSGIIPFKITKVVASDKFKEWISGCWFTPNIVQKSASPTSFNGIYLPYWTFDTKTESEYSGRYGIDKTVKDKDGEEKTETDWYPTCGDFRQAFNDWLVLASTRHSEDFLRGIEPFDTENNVRYKPQYVSGFIAERYSVGIQEGWEKAQAELEEELKDIISAHVRKSKNADHVQISSLKVDYLDNTFKYLMLPIWLSAFRYRGKIYQFAVNGQTGKVDGDYPLSYWKIFFAVVSVIAFICLLSKFFS